MKTLLFAVTISALFIVGVGAQEAFAAPGHSAFGKNPGAGGTCVGCDMGINIGVASPEANGVRGSAICIVEDPDGDLSQSTTEAGLTSQCINGFPGNDGQYLLVDGADLPGTVSPICAYWNKQTTGHVTLRMGPGAGSAVAGLSGSATPFECSDGPVGSDPPDFSGAGIEGTPVWYNIADGSLGIPNANLHNRYLVMSPGCDDNAAPINDGVCSTSDQVGLVFETYFVSSPMAGEVLPTSTVSLAIAGITSSGLWILASLGAVAGVSFAILRLQANGRNF